MTTENNERWLSDGNCLLCRRAKYCKKPCKAQRERKAAIIKAMQEHHAKQKEDADK